ncbi:MAG: VOC family protein [Roseitalea porphyridii]|jgi:catechol 2,3-dioxygenase-like lactoylglutathione lyase family enzyme|uniref:VOC family protein n=1 Tax=Roseitalea porphyridii TaxID=1852022 RepID=UPI0032EE6F36
MQPDGILETALYADDLAAAKAFYGTVIGLSVITEVAGRHVFFRCGDGVLLLFDPAATAQPPSDPSMPVPPHGAHGPGHACFRVAGDALDGWRDHLEEAGIAIEADFRWPNGARSLYFRDPAGNSLEISEPKLWGLA